MDKILITGGAGFIGSNLVRQWLADEQVVLVNLDKLTYAGSLDSLANVLVNPRHIFVEGDIGDGPLLRRLLREHRPQAMVNLAAETHVDRSIDSPAGFVDTNIVGTFQLLESCRDYWSQLPAADRGGFRFLHVSTDEVYGSLGPSGRFSEMSPYRPRSPYAATKAAADHLVQAYHHTFGLPTLGTNASNNYGPCQFPEKLIPLAILKALAGEPIPVYGDGQHVRDWLYVDDHCRAIRTVLRHGTPGETYNVGGHEERTNLQVVEAICAGVDRLCPGSVPAARLITLVADRPGHDRRYAMDCTKIERQFGWKPRETLESGLELTIRWYLENQAWVRRVMSGKYGGERLGLPSSREQI